MAAELGGVKVDEDDELLRNASAVDSLLGGVAAVNWRPPLLRCARWVGHGMAHSGPQGGCRGSVLPGAYRRGEPPGQGCKVLSSFSGLCLSPSGPHAGSSRGL